MDGSEKIGFVSRGLKPALLEKVNLMKDNSMKALRENLQKVETTNFMLERREEKRALRLLQPGHPLPEMHLREAQTATEGGQRKKLRTCGGVSSSRSIHQIAIL
ncbi:uncharacterized protein isoform X2 [Leptinotarsa decemlineata]|uniref:uncharacterized protein isoform X2 n=1 Tax=Leptinotarsa decemlineata TaxID=7539 RepID=UPI003D307169